MPTILDTPEEKHTFRPHWLRDDRCLISAVSMPSRKKRFAIGAFLATLCSWDRAPASPSHPGSQWCETPLERLARDHPDLYMEVMMLCL